ncbi:energy-coupled thiamine transporter ThiT [Caldicellulosiruptoraceae bacterium PP1]
MKGFFEIFKKFSELKPETIGILVVLVLVCLFLILGRNRLKFNTKSIVYGGLTIALSFILSYIRVYKMPQGGSITLASMLPIFVYSYIFGPFAGIAAGIGLGILQLIQDAYVVHWVQLLLDYPIAFGVLGLAGLFRKNLPLGILFGGLMRFLAHFLSGFIFFAEYAPKGMNPIYYSFVYNISYILPELIICIIIYYIPNVRKSIDRIISNM